MQVEQGEMWWAELEEPAGSEPGLRPPVVVVQGNAINRGRIGTVVCVPLTTRRLQLILGAIDTILGR